MDGQWSSPRRTLVVLAGLFSLGFLLLVGRLAYIQIADRDKLCRLADEQQTMRIPAVSYRGALVDRVGRPLATTTEGYSIYADPKMVLNPDCDVDSRQAARHPTPRFPLADVALRLASVLGESAGEVEQKIAGHADKRFVWLKRRIDRPTRDAVLALKLPGIGFLPEGERCYATDGLAANVLGPVGIDNQGLDAMELLLDKRLRGTDGYRTVRVDAKRRPVAPEHAGTRGPADGQIAVLTIDLSIQMFTEQALKEAVDQFHAKGGMAIVMDPCTGDVLALANYPSFDPESYGQAKPYARRNRLLTDPYEPGSTFKCFIASVALEERLVRPGEKIFCHNGIYRVPGRTLRDVHPYGTLSFEDVVVKSSNIGMGIIGLRMGNRRLYDALMRFGFGRPTGILLPGESPGLVRALEKWTSLSATSVPMGYEIMVTPLQIVTAFSAIANGGLLMKPRIVRGVYAADGQVVADLSQPVVAQRALKQQTADFMRLHVLRDVVTRGTGTKAEIPGYEVFGKTGTAKKRDPNGKGYSDLLYFGSFIGAAPLKDPRVVVMVVIDEPDRSQAYYGGSVAGPAVRQILEKSLGYLRIEPDESALLARAGR